MANILDPMDLKQIITFHLDVLPHKFHASVVLICLFRPDSDCAFYQYFHQLGIRTFLTFACLRYVKVGIEPKIINIALPKSKSIKFVRGTCVAFMLTCVSFSIFDPVVMYLGQKSGFLQMTKIQLFFFFSIFLEHLECPLQRCRECHY